MKIARSTSMEKQERPVKYLEIPSGGGNIAKEIY